MKKSVWLAIVLEYLDFLRHPSRSRSTTPARNSGDTILIFRPMNKHLHLVTYGWQMDKREAGAGKIGDGSDFWDRELRTVPDFSTQVLQAIAEGLQAALAGA